ncbi:hypothetical protein [Flammeovirga sp. OC4]|uniref:hypothetical protein n=1 Tax=Flammeovirga sp. OC4 TaxID=1382345 RepID=UPI0005C6D3DE|nr:hypothetical protein [Flammeovirga sp. OC4]
MQYKNMNLCRTLIVTTVTFLLTLSVFSQTKTDWKVQTSKDGNFLVKSKVYSVKGELGKKKFLEYEATTQFDVDFERCVLILKNVGNHKIIINEKESRLLDSISENKSLIYYFFEPTWPFKNSDCVAFMISSINYENEKATFQIEASPSSYKSLGVNRLTDYSMTFTIKKLISGKVEINTTAKISPTVNVPNFMLKAFFPKGPIDILKRIDQLSKND